MTKFVCFASFAAVAMGALSGSLAHADVLNGDFSQVGPYGYSVYNAAISGGWSAAADWEQFAVETPGAIDTYLVVDGGPGGLTNALYVTTPTPSVSQFYEEGSGVFQDIAVGTGAHLEFDLYVISGTVTGGLGQATGPFFDFTPYSYTGSWVHVTQDDYSPAVLVAFEDLYNSDATYEIANVHETTFNSTPGPTAVVPMLTGLIPILRRRRRRSAL